MVSNTSDPSYPSYPSSPSFSDVEPFQVPSIYWHDTNSKFMAWLFTKASIRVLRAAHALVGASIRVCVSLSNLLTKRFYCFFFLVFSLFPFHLSSPPQHNSFQAFNVQGPNLSSSTFTSAWVSLFLDFLRSRSTRYRRMKSE